MRNRADWFKLFRDSGMSENEANAACGDICGDGSTVPQMDHPRTGSAAPPVEKTRRQYFVRWHFPDGDVDQPMSDYFDQITGQAVKMRNSSDLALRVAGQKLMAQITAEQVEALNANVQRKQASKKPRTHKNAPAREKLKAMMRKEKRAGADFKGFLAHFEQDREIDDVILLNVEPGKNETGDAAKAYGKSKYTIEVDEKTLTYTLNTLEKLYSES